MVQKICQYEAREFSNYTALSFRESLINDHLRQRIWKITNPILGRHNEFFL
jgi:hypothetical protein